MQKHLVLELDIREICEDAHEGKHEIGIVLALGKELISLFDGLLGVVGHGHDLKGGYDRACVELFAILLHDQ